MQNTAHCLNLVLVKTVKSIPKAYCFFSLLQKLYVFVSGSNVHQRWLEGDVSGDSPSRVAKANRDTWACRYKSCKIVMERLPAIIKNVSFAEQCNIGAAPPGRQVTPSFSFAGYYISTPIVKKQGNTDKDHLIEVHSFQLLICLSLR